MSRVVEKYGITFKKDEVVSFLLSEDHLTGYTEEQEIADEIMLDHNYERCTIQRLARTTSRTEIIILESDNHKVAHKRIREEMLNKADAIHIASDRPTVLEMSDGHLILSPLSEYDEDNDSRYSNSPSQDHDLVRYYCAKCDKRLQMKYTKQIIKNGIWECNQDVFMPCSEHPDAGFYNLFINDRY
jgi:hypothetical protein